MNFMPIIGFYWRQSEIINKLLDRGDAHGGGVRLLLDLAEANADILKERYPVVTENGFLDDAIKTLKETTATVRQMPQPKAIKHEGKITQAVLDAGADAIHRVAERYGMASYITRDQERELAAEVMHAYADMTG